MNPIVSIIVPVYNVELYLRKCLDSILAQTFTNFEAVLVDDGSSDNCGAICDEYAAKDSRFVVIHQQNAGIIEARIVGLHHSQGQMIAFVDDDDYLAPDYVEKLSYPIIYDGVDLVSCDYCLIEDGKVKNLCGKLTGIYDREGIDDFMAHHYFYD